ncbi:MAG: hypothetical protein IPH82_10575 [Chloroflexi bacterium]|nr:hypothetical protein [Chloroflexota bacterium]
MASKPSNILLIILLALACIVSIAFHFSAARLFLRRQPDRDPYAAACIAAQRSVGTHPQLR